MYFCNSYVPLLECLVYFNEYYEDYQHIMEHTVIFKQYFPSFDDIRYASELTLPRAIIHYGTNVPSLKELTDFQQLPENPLDMLARLFWIGVSLLESDFEHEFVMAVNLIEEVSVHKYLATHYHKHVCHFNVSPSFLGQHLQTNWASWFPL